MHHVRGLIASADLLSDFSEKHALHSPVPLIDGLGLLPLSLDDIETRLAPSRTDCPDGFEHLFGELAEKCSAASVSGPVLYFETDYFGGYGGQGAVVFDSGTRVFGPKSGDIGPINEALRVLGVRVQSPAIDEFQSVGLHLHRSVEDWFKSSY